MTAGDLDQARDVSAETLAEEWDAVRDSVEATPDSAIAPAPRAPDREAAGGPPAASAHRIRLSLALAGVALALILSGVLLFAALAKEGSPPRRARSAPDELSRGRRSGRLHWAGLPGTGEARTEPGRKTTRSAGAPRHSRPGRPRVPSLPDRPPKPAPEEGEPSFEATPQASPPPEPPQSQPSPSPPPKPEPSDGSKSSVEFGL